MNLKKTVKTWAFVAGLAIFAFGVLGCQNAGEDNTPPKVVDPPKDAPLKPDMVPGGTGGAGANPGSTTGAASGQAETKTGGFPPPPDH
jgi:hypothetical protein